MASLPVSAVPMAGPTGPPQHHSALARTTYLAIMGKSYSSPLKRKHGGSLEAFQGLCRSPRVSAEGLGGGLAGPRSARGERAGRWLVFLWIRSGHQGVPGQEIVLLSRLHR